MDEHDKPKIEIGFYGEKFDHRYRTEDTREPQPGIPFDAMPELINLQKLLHAVAARVRHERDRSTKARATKQLKDQFTLVWVDTRPGSVKGSAVLDIDEQLFDAGEIDLILSELERDFQLANQGHYGDIPESEFKELEKLGKTMDAENRMEISLPGGGGYVANRKTVQDIGKWKKRFGEVEEANGTIIASVKRLLPDGADLTFWTGQGPVKLDLNGSKFDAVRDHFSEQNIPVIRIDAEYSKRDEKIITIHSLRSLEVIGRNDMRARLREIARLENGWHDGDGEQITAASLISSSTLDELVPELAVFSTYPTLEGGIQYEYYPLGSRGYIEIHVSPTGGVQGVYALNNLNDETERELSDPPSVDAFIREWKEKLGAMIESQIDLMVEIPVIDTLDICQRIARPEFMDEKGEPTSSVFAVRPNRDGGKLSTYLQTKLSADEALNTYGVSPGQGYSVWGVSVEEVHANGLQVIDDGGPKGDPSSRLPYGHASIDMTSLNTSQQNKKARQLKRVAINRGRLDTP